MTKLEEKFAMAVMFGELQDVANGQLTGQDCSKLVKWFEAGIAADRERILVELEEERACFADKGWRAGIKRAIEIVKGGEDETN